MDNGQRTILIPFSLRITITCNKTTRDPIRRLQFTALMKAYTVYYIIEQFALLLLLYIPIRYTG